MTLIIFPNDQRESLIKKIENYIWFEYFYQTLNFDTLNEYLKEQLIDATLGNELYFDTTSHIEYNKNKEKQLILKIWSITGTSREDMKKFIAIYNDNYKHSVSSWSSKLSITNVFYDMLVNERNMLCNYKQRMISEFDVYNKLYKKTTTDKNNFTRIQI